LCVSIFISAHTKSHTKVFFRHKKCSGSSRATAFIKNKDKNLEFMNGIISFVASI
jgi:hypothetical protein